MRRHYLTAALVAATLSAPSRAETDRAPTPASVQQYSPTTSTLAWTFHYRQNPQPTKVPYAFLALSKAGSLRDPEQAGIYLGFLAGVLKNEGARADRLLVKLTGLPHEDQWILVRALAYSGLPDWRDLIARLEKHIPDRAGMIEAYLDGSTPTLDQIELEPKKPSDWDQFKDSVTFRKPEKPSHKPTFATNSELIDTLWGLYFATGDVEPIAKLVKILPWAKDHESVPKLSIGSMVAYTLAENASRSPDLLATVKTMSQQEQPKETLPLLKEVVRAAETADTGYLRKDALAAIDNLKLRGPDSWRNMAMWGQVAEGGIALGCLGAALSGAGATVGVPCVIGGALASAGLKVIAQP